MTNLILSHLTWKQNLRLINNKRNFIKSCKTKRVSLLQEYEEYMQSLKLFYDTAQLQKQRANINSCRIAIGCFKGIYCELIYAQSIEKLINIGIKMDKLYSDLHHEIRKDMNL